MINSSEISKLVKGDKINYFLLIRRAEVKVSKTNKKFLSMDLGDQSGAISTNLWEEYEQIFDQFIVGKVVKVAGTIEEYQGSPQLRIETIRLTTDSELVTPKDFLPHSLRNLDEMKSELDSFINSIENTYLNQLVKNLFSGERFEKFIDAPAGKTIHHSYIHGLLEHTLEIAKICDLMGKIHPEINRDLLISGALLHDFAKIEELLFESSFEYSDSGKLVGHIVLCALLVEKEIEMIEAFPHELKNLLVHLILSHQGKLEFASPVVPKTLEAIILYQADELSAKSNAYKRILLNDNSDAKWTKYSSHISTELYKNFSNKSEQIKSTLFD
ncbi:MAG: HD domain-containing protein [Ignavibacteriaceae bacterium]|nr:HD domain-containing protein [Ignavibacteriaceae bacterium]